MNTFIKKAEKSLLQKQKITYRRYLYSRIDFSSQMVGIVGARGVGKTTLLLQYLQELKQNYEYYKSIYLSYDHPMSADINLFEFAEEFAKLGGVYLLLDEIHKYKKFSLDLKAIYDFYPELKVIFTGSCAVSIYNAQADLSRRVRLYALHGLSYREYFELKTGQVIKAFELNSILENHIQIVDELKEQFIPLEHFSNYLKNGYYPFYFKDPDWYLEYLYEVINLTIDIDMVNLGLINSAYTQKLKKLLNILSQSNPFELNITKVSALAGVTRKTLYSYLYHLSKGKLLHIIPDSKKGLTGLNKPEKLYLNNTNLLYALNTQPSIGTIRETFFANQVAVDYNLTTSKNGDFLVDEKYIFEVGGKNKSFNQIKNIKDSFLVIDDESTEHPSKIPLWLFGFLY